MSATDNLFNDGAAYERLMGRWSRRVSDSFIDWIDVPPNLRWLDVGCGTGVFAEELLRRCAPAAVSGIDPSEEQLVFARGRLDKRPAEFRVGGAEALPYPDDSFDAAVMALVIHFVPDPAKGVAEMARVVRPSGYVAAYTWDYATRGSPTAPVLAVLRSFGFDPAPPPSAMASQREALQDLWEKAGLERIETRAIRILVEFSDFDDFWGSVSVPVGPAGKVLSRISPDDRERLRAHLREQAPTSADGRIAYEARANAVKGRVPA